MTEHAPLTVRPACAGDLPAIRAIYNEGIEDRVATLDVDAKTERDIAQWYEAHDGRYAVLVADSPDGIAGWASLNRYSHRCAYDAVADLSIYVARTARGRGIGALLLAAVERRARENAFHKVVLFAITLNEAARRLYRGGSYREVGIFREQGRLDGRLVDVVAMEKLFS
jgi:phosphinothricin acetyltransferase